MSGKMPVGSYILFGVGFGFLGAALITLALNGQVVAAVVMTPFAVLALVGMIWDATRS